MDLFTPDRSVKWGAVTQPGRLYPQDFRAPDLARIAGLRLADSGQTNLPYPLPHALYSDFSSILSLVLALLFLLRRIFWPLLGESSMIFTCNVESLRRRRHSSPPCLPTPLPSFNWVHPYLEGRLLMPLWGCLPPFGGVFHYRTWHADAWWSVLRGAFLGRLVRSSEAFSCPLVTERLSC